MKMSEEELLEQNLQVEEKEIGQNEQKIQMSQPKEEKPETLEEKIEYKESNEIKEQDQEPEQEIIIFANLSKEDKKKYFNYFIKNDTIFTREEEGTWIAEIDSLEEVKPESNSLLLSEKNNSDLKSLRQSKFRSTKKDYDTIYNKLINVINPPQGIKGAKMDINAIKYMIQEIYSLKFLKDTQALLNKEDVEPDPFPVFVGNFLINKFPKKDTLYKKSIDFMLSLDFYGMKHKDIKTFQQFVTEEYDSDDLIFYLFVRSCIEKEQKQLFLERAKENLGQGLIYGQEDDDILVPVKKCKKLAKAIFGSEEEELMNKFLENIQILVETEPADDKKKYLKANSILNMALVKYHESRDKIEEENDDKNENEEDEKSKEEEEEEYIPPDKKSPIIKGKTVLENKKSKEEKPKIKKEIEETKDELIGNNNNKEKVEIEIDDSNNIDKSQNVKLRSNKKSNLKNTTSTSNQNQKVNISTKPKNQISKPPKTTISKPVNTTKVSNINNRNPKTTIGSKNLSNKTNLVNSVRNNYYNNKTGVYDNSKNALTKTTISKPVQRTSQEKRRNIQASGNRSQISTSVGKRPVKKNINAFNLDENKVEQTLEFKKILNKNRIEKVKSESEKSACLCYIINDYFKLKEVDVYFKNIIEQNPIFQPLSAKIYANLKNPKEFLLKKLSGICKYISVGDKNGFYNFMKIKDKNGKSNYEGFKSSFNSLLKSGPLKNLNEIDISNFCKSILEMPELSFQTSKSLLKLCE